MSISKHSQKRHHIANQVTNCRALFLETTESNDPLSGEVESKNNNHFQCVTIEDDSFVCCFFCDILNNRLHRSAPRRHRRNPRTRRRIPSLWKKYHHRSYYSLLECYRNAFLPCLGGRLHRRVAVQRRPLPIDRPALPHRSCFLHGPRVGALLPPR